MRRVPAGRRLRRLVNPSTASFCDSSILVLFEDEGCEEERSRMRRSDEIGGVKRSILLCFVERKVLFMEEFIDLFIFDRSRWNMGIEYV